MTRQTLREVMDAWTGTLPDQPCTCFLTHRNQWGPVEVVDPACPDHGDDTP